MASPVAEDTFPRQYARTRRLTLGQPRTFQITPDGSRLLFLRAAEPDDATLRLWSIDVTDGDPGPERLLADPVALGSDEADLPAAERARRERARESAGGIVSYAVAPDSSMATFALAGELYVTDLSTEQTVSIDTAGSVFDPRPNHDGSLVAYVSGQELRVVGTGIGGAAPAPDELVAADEAALVSWGRADFIAAEEMGRSRGFWWSPVGNQLLATRVDDQPVSSWWIADPANPDRSPNEIRYPAAGTTNPNVRLFSLTADPAPDGEHATADGWTRREVEWSDGREYLADVVWSTGHDPLIVRQTRDQRTVEIVDLDAEELATAVRATITDDVWVELMPGSPTWFGNQLLTIEDRADLDRRVACLDGEPIPGTEALHVKAILGTSSSHIIAAAWTHPTEVHIVSIDPEAGTTTVLTDEPGVHGASCGEGLIVVTSTRPAEPGSTTTVHRLDTSSRVPAQLDPAAAVVASQAETPVLRCDPIFCELGGRGLHGALLLPSDHDGTSPLPVLLDPYGGPHAQRVLKAHNSHLVSQWFAEQGYAVLVVDGRGTPGRGPGFEREVYGDLAQPVLDDQIDALDAVAEQYPFLDMGRVGIRGWSFGGYLAALAVLRRPDRVHAAIAGAPVTTWHLYDTHYTERYLGHPVADPDHYRQTDLLEEAASLTRPLLLIHGLADDNVVAAHTLRFSSALLAAGRPHQVLPLSGVTHMTPQVVVAENLLHLQRDFLAASLKALAGS